MTLAGRAQSWGRSARVEAIPELSHPENHWDRHLGLSPPPASPAGVSTAELSSPLDTSAPEAQGQRRMEKGGGWTGGDAAGLQGALPACWPLSLPVGSAPQQLAPPDEASQPCPTPLCKSLGSHRPQSSFMAGRTSPGLPWRLWLPALPTGPSTPSAVNSSCQAFLVLILPPGRPCLREGKAPSYRAQLSPQPCFRGQSSADPLHRGAPECSSHRLCVQGPRPVQVQAPWAGRHHPCLCPCSGLGAGGLATWRVPAARASWWDERIAPRQGPVLPQGRYRIAFPRQQG